MSSGSGQTFSYVNKTAVGSNFRFGMEDRMRGWNNTFEPTVLQNNASNYNYYVVSVGCTHIRTLVNQSMELMIIFGSNFKTESRTNFGQQSTACVRNTESSSDAGSLAGSRRTTATNVQHTSRQVTNLHITSKLFQHGRSSLNTAFESI